MIESIRLKNFRKHQDTRLEFDNEFNLIYGRNNAGKSTIFYAIEYCLFGNVQGFKKISQLTNYKKKAVGVQLIFRGRDGNTYKLQRMHKISGKSRSAKGFYTLKKIVDDGEAYILSSDHGEREEDLSLKINELLGITKRFFETGILFYQGSVSEILKGDKKLDIVFGITSAIALAETFGEYALEYEKEVKGISTFKATLDQSKKERIEYQKKLDIQIKEEELNRENILTKKEELDHFNQFKEHSQLISQAVEKFQEKRKNLENFNLKNEIIRKELEESKIKFGSIPELRKENDKLRVKLDEINKSLISTEKEFEKNQNGLMEIEKEKVEKEGLQKQKSELLKEINNIIKEKGEKQELEKTVREKRKQVSIIMTDTSEVEKELQTIQDFFRTTEREKGDIEGILQRRKETKDKPKCEYCGNDVDPQRIIEDINEYQEKLRLLDKQIKNREDKNKSLKIKLNKLRDDEKQLNKDINDFESIVNNLNNLENKLQDGLNQNFEEIISKIQKSKEKIENSIKSERDKLNILRQDENKIQEKSNELESQLKHYDELNEKLEEISKEIKEAQISHNKEKELLLKTLMETKKEIESRLKGKLKKESTKNEIFKAKINIILEKIDDVKTQFSIENTLNIKEDLKELIITKIAEISTSISHYSQQAEKYKIQIEETKNNIKRLDKDIANTEKKIQDLEEKEKIAIKYRKYQDVFKEVQGIIRENICSILEEKILELHEILSTTKEFERLHVDSKDYSLSITPLNMEEKEAYPANLYEGGGQKLILGISYKFSLGQILGTAPFLLIDEPTEFMDQENRINLLSNLSSVLKNNQLMLITHQDVNKIRCNKKIEIN